MNKVSSIILLAIVGLAMAGNPKIRESNDAYTCHFSESFNSMHVELRGYEISPNATATFYLDNIAGFDQVNFYISAVSSGNITTASMQPILSMGEIILTPSILTSGTDMTTFKSMFYSMAIVNNVATTVNLTGNILVTK